MRRFTAAERRARLASRHLLSTARAASPLEVAEALVALHSTSAPAVYLSIRARLPDVRVEQVEAALYEERSLVRLLGMRRTVFVVPTELAPAVQAACSDVIAERQRRRLAGFLEQAGITRDGAAWLERVEAATLAALRARGEAFAVELTEDVPELRHRLRFSEGKAYEGVQGVSTLVLLGLAAAGHIVRGRPRGSWLSSQYRWSPVERWLPGGLRTPPRADAQAELARRWLRAYGPGTRDDLRWWAGWTVRETAAALAAVGAVQVELEAGPGFVLPDDLDAAGAPAAPPPAAVLLPALDPSVMGWTGRDWYLGPHRPALFDRAGNAGPTIWWDGRVVGGWGQRRGGEVVHRLLEDVGAEAERAIAAEAERLGRWLGGVRVTPAFRTPLERSLADPD